MRTVLTADWLWNGSALVAYPVIEIEDGRIASLATRSGHDQSEPADPLHFPGATLAPGFFDIHIHGAAGHDVMEATPQALDTIGRFIAQHGTATYLATTVTAPVDATLKTLSSLARRINREPATDQPIARPIGIHLEGPFLSHAKRGVHPPAHLKEPDTALFDRFFEAAEGHIKLLTLAPELPTAAAFAAHATARGVRVSVGHSNATAAQTRSAIAAGATSATHTFNAMRPLNHREPGILGTVLSNDALYAELICDGIHSLPELVKIWWRAKGPARAVLVTDAMSATGMPDGDYQLGGFTVQVANGKATMDGVLAGSLLTLDRALSNLIAFTGASLDQALRALTTNPAAMTGLESQAGFLAIGQPANLVAVDAHGSLLASFLNGKQLEQTLVKSCNRLW